MADRVQFIMDRMAVTFREMEQFGVFTAAEVKSVVKKRTDFEYKLRRRQQTPADYYGYLQYELSLEELRGTRCRRQSHSHQTVGEEAEFSKELINKHRKLQSAFMKHISYVFERALRRFPDNMALWNDYISFLQDKKAHSTLNTVFGRALCLHPKNESLWLQAAVFEINCNSNAHAARVLLQRALRVNKLSQKLWKTYFELELWHVARGLERRRLLGLKQKAGATSPPQDQEEAENEHHVLGVPWVVYRHAIKYVPTVGFAMAMLKATGPGCAGGGQSSPLQVALQRELQERFHYSQDYWAAMLQLSAEGHVAGLNKELQLRRLSGMKARQALQKKRALTLTLHKAEEPVPALLEDTALVSTRLRVAVDGLRDGLELLQACAGASKPSARFLGACCCDMLGALAPALSLPSTADARLSALDLFRSQAGRQAQGPSVVEELFARLAALASFLQSASLGQDDPVLLAAQLDIASLQSILFNQYPTVLGSASAVAGGELRGACGCALSWLERHASDAQNINEWAVLADKALRACSTHALLTPDGDGMCGSQELAALVLARGAQLVNPPQEDAMQQKQRSSALPSPLAAALSSAELKTNVFARAIEVTLRQQSTGFGAARGAVEAALLGRVPPCITISSQPAATDAVYVDWLLRYLQLVLLHRGEEHWRAACEFVEARCFSARPHCVASLSLDRYYEQVLGQAMAQLRASSAGAGEGAGGSSLLDFCQRLMRGGVSRCPGNACFLEAQEEAARLAGQHEQANHTRWKRSRAL